MAVRNRADVVGRAVASVVAQTFADLEVVVVDAGSTDHSADAARAVGDRRVRVMPDDRGDTDSAVVAGLRGARGEWLTVLGPDDEVDPGWLARLGRLADATGTAAVGCGGEQLHRDGTRTEVSPAAGSLCCRTGTVLVRRGLVAPEELVGPPTELAAALGQRARDLERPAVSTPEVLVRWNEPTDGGSGDHEQLQLRWARQSIDAIARAPIPDPRLLVRSATRGGIAAVRLGDHREARRLFRLARRVAPDAPRHWARWAVSLVPPVARLAWCVDEGEPCVDRIRAPDVVREGD